MTVVKKIWNHTGPMLAMLSVGCGVEGEGSNEARFDEPLYAMVTQVYDRDGDRTNYMWLSHTLDPEEVTLDGAREYPGVANFNVIGGKLLVSSGQEPSITEFRVSDDYQWLEGRTVSFSGYPLDDNANWYYQFVLDAHTAYLPFDVTGRIVWDPSAMTITGVHEDSSLELQRGGLLLEAGGNRNGVRYPDTVLQAFFYHDEDWIEYGDSSVIVSYDADTHEERDVLDAPCPGLALATRDERGTTYFSTWDYLPGLALYGVGPAPCAVRVTPEGTLDEAWTTDFTELTGGRYVVNFRYIGGGRALGNVLHREELDIDFSGPVDDEVLNTLWENGPAWRLWLFDLEGGTAHPIEGIDVELGSGAQFAVIDERTFAFVPIDDWTRSKVYEIDEDGAAREHFEIAGDIFKWVRVR